MIAAGSYYGVAPAIASTQRDGVKATAAKGGWRVR